uniref:Uncharacterized protein n=1 Tax=Anguilla anguilla TaxID=7936 RepID=A0A0E9Q3P3_ANGAN
MSRSLLCC